jgi:hypothetical protein
MRACVRDAIFICDLPCFASVRDPTWEEALGAHTLEHPEAFCLRALLKIWVGNAHLHPRCVAACIAHQRATSNPVVSRQATTLRSNAELRRWRQIHLVSHSTTLLSRIHRAATEYTAHVRDDTAHLACAVRCAHCKQPSRHHTGNRLLSTIVYHCRACAQLVNRRTRATRSHWTAAACHP